MKIKRAPVPFVGLLFLCMHAIAQKAMDQQLLQKQIDSINRLIDRAVVEKRISLLQKHYAPDFIFIHGTGTVDSKGSWIKYIGDTSVLFILRRHDSTQVELHPGLAIVSGTLTVHRKHPHEISRYALRYIRVYALRKKIWKLISHRTTAEWHL